ncbi:hypothetical protein CABS01_13872 [Colletotrichum abscissum]|uniref:uncharacterized protein n=1 Tax=Colletotrichum abscissum TaxID=1671311 RepID=UPI0027D5A101|nr:uncharacterized protein CABS01_13872 [Colletotrichum abscissum]KAK1484449.1 hypothetical protein CABS01_13872 [Colletotrichum abscissum]
MPPNNRPWVKAILDFPGLDFYIEGDAPLFNRRVNAAYLKLFSHNDSVHGRDHIALRQHYIANRGNVLFRAIINLYISGKHANFSTLYGAALTRLAEDSGPSREWEDSSELGIDSVTFVVDRIIRARIQNLRANNTSIEEPNPVVEAFLATLDEWIAVLDERKMRASTSFEPNAPADNQFSLPLRPHPNKPSVASSSNASSGNKMSLPYRPHPKTKQEQAMQSNQEIVNKRIQDLESQLRASQAKSQEALQAAQARSEELAALRNANIARLEEQETLETVNEALRTELDEAKKARRRIW